MEAASCEFMMLTGLDCQDDNCNSIHEICQAALTLDGCAEFSCNLVHFCDDIREEWMIAMHVDLLRDDFGGLDAGLGLNDVLDSFNNLSLGEEEGDDKNNNTNTDSLESIVNFDEDGGRTDHTYISLSFKNRKDKFTAPLREYTRSQLNGRDPTLLKRDELYPLFCKIEIVSNDDFDLEGEESCPICHDKFDIGSKIQRLPCFHSMCSDCVKEWFDDTLAWNNKECPICRDDIYEGLRRICDPPPQD